MNLQALLDALPALVSYWDRDLRNRMANAAYREYFGKSPEEMQGTHISELMGPEAYEQNRPHIERVLAGEPQLFDREITTPAGEARYTQASFVPDLADGEVVGFFALLTDITERRRAELGLQESEERYRTLVEHLPSSVVTLVGTDLRLRWVAGGVVRETGMDVEGMLGRPVRETSGGGEHGELIEGLYARALAGEPISTEVHSRVTGRDFSVEIAPVHDRDGEVTAALGVAQDITERREREAEEQTLATIATLVAEGAEPETVFTAVAEQLGALFDASVAAVTRFDADTGTGTVVGGWSSSGSDPTGGTFDLEGGTASAAAFRSGRPARLDAPAVSPADPAARTIERYSIMAGIAAPVFVGGSLWGTIGAAFEAEEIPENAEQRLARFAPLIAIAIANAQARDELARQASSDPLTGLANRRAFQERLRSEVARAERYGRDLSLALFDLDRFKAVNDRHGHPAGDRVLAEVARRLRAVAREDGLVARIGGEEFAWLIPEAGEREAHVAAERVRRAIESEPFVGAGSLTTSAGVCSNLDAADADELVSHADKALYLAKHSGRNATRVHTTPP